MFYMYNQNNSGGNFITDDKVCRFVIVEAEYADNADIFAEDIGIYFNGCDNDIDCPCCGDRWSPAWESLDEPKIYSFNPEDYDDIFAQVGEVYCRVYYKDGSVKEYKKV